MLDVSKLRIAGKINGRPVIYLHVLQFYCEHGYVPDRIGTADDGTLFDMTPMTDILGFFRGGGIGVPIGDMIADKATGGIKFRRADIERLVADGDLCYDGVCYRST